MEHEWLPKMGVKPPHAAIQYYCTLCHREGTERDIRHRINPLCPGPKVWYEPARFQSQDTLGEVCSNQNAS